MKDTKPHGYEAEIVPVESKPGHFAWILRKNGQLFQRSDRYHTSEEKAREDALTCIEKMHSPFAR